MKPWQQSKGIFRLRQQNSSRKRSLIEGKMSWALKKLQVKQPGIDEEEDMLSRHHAEVATELDQYSEKRKSLHHTEVATEDEQLKEPLCRDIWKLSRHQH